MTFGAVERVKAEADIDLLDLSNENVFIQVAQGGARRIMHLLFAMLRPQIEAAGLKPEEFAEALAGEQVEDACNAFREEWLDFFRNPAERRVLQAALEKTREFELRAEEMILKQMGQGGHLDRMMQQVLEEMSARMDALSANSSGPSPASSASTPGTSA
jgi:hypothetical protein